MRADRVYVDKAIEAINAADVILNKAIDAYSDHEAFWADICEMNRRLHEYGLDLKVALEGIPMTENDVPPARKPSLEDFDNLARGLLERAAEGRFSVWTDRSRWTIEICADEAPIVVTAFAPRRESGPALIRTVDETLAILARIREAKEP